MNPEAHDPRRVPIALLDIEGTIADARFVHDVLFPFARRALPAFVRARRDEPEVAAELDATASQAGLDRNDLEGLIGQLLRWIDDDVKATPLKALQGMIWRRGYAEGEFTAPIYDDALAWMRRARDAGVGLYIYSSGSVEAQKLYFAHTDHGDLTDWIDGHFDTRIGAKRTAAAYRSIAASIGTGTDGIAFYSDVVEELDAAAEAGCRTVHIRRDGQPDSTRHAQAPSFDSLPLPGRELA